MKPPKDVVQRTAQVFARLQGLPHDRARLQALSHDRPTRHLAALFFEFMTPGVSSEDQFREVRVGRHPSCHLLTTEKRFVPVTTKVDKKMGQLPQYYKEAYHCNSFQQYLDNRLWTTMTPEEFEEVGDDTDDGELPRPDTIPYEHVYSELRRSAAVAPWLIKGSRRVRVTKRPHILLFTGHWLRADNHVRQRSWQHFLRIQPTEEEDRPPTHDDHYPCHLTQLYETMLNPNQLAPNFDNLVQDRVKQLDYLLRQVFSQADKSYRKHHLNFTLSREDAMYLKLLYQRPLPHLKPTVQKKFGLEEAAAPVPKKTKKKKKPPVARPKKMVEPRETTDDWKM